MGILENIRKKFAKNKRKVYSADEISKLCIGYSDEVKLLSHAVDVSKPEDKAYFASRTERFINNYAELKKEIAISKEVAEEAGGTVGGCAGCYIARCENTGKSIL